MVYIIYYKIYEFSMLSVFRGSVADCAPSGFCCSMTLDGAVVPRFGIFPTWRRKFHQGPEAHGDFPDEKSGSSRDFKGFHSKKHGFLWDFMGCLSQFVVNHGISWEISFDWDFLWKFMAYFGGLKITFMLDLKVSLPMSHCSMGWFGWENLNRKLAGFSPKICWEGPLEFPIMQLTCLSWVQLGQVNVQLNFWCLG